MRLKYPMQLLCMIAFANTSYASDSIPMPTRPIVVELFTSQGCNSCPPADELLGEYANDHNVIALAFHVNYWDYLGWHDPFALPIGAQRQADYVRSLKLSSAFTPQMIIDGNSSIVGSDRRSLVSAINAQRSGIPVSISKTNDHLLITLPESGMHGQFDVSMIAYQSFASTPVPRGENSGHTLKEYNIVRTFQSLSSWNGHATSLNVPMANISRNADHLAIVIQKGNQGEITGAASIAL